jgi:3-dehydroquinate synthase
MRVVTVPLGPRTYSIKIGSGWLDRVGVECRQLGLGERCAVLTDRHVAAHYADRVVAALRAAGFDPVVISVTPGERSKSLAVACSIYGQLAKHRLERRSFLVALGGGVVGDLAGFVAATYLRGIPFVQVPTSLLAQVDSSVGGKVGVNLPQGKNLVGAFHQPTLVLCDLETLATLSPRELRSGLAEVIKYGMIYDTRFFARLERAMEHLLALDAVALERVVARCCEIKAEVVAQDETESGLRAILNFGHTFGHALEAVSGYGRHLHGEAVAIGMNVAAALSRAVLGLSAQAEQRLADLIRRAGLPVSVILSHGQQKRIWEAMRLDKKVSAGQVRFVLAERIGQVRFGQVVPAEVLGATLARMTRSGAGRSEAIREPSRGSGRSAS